MLCFQHLRYFCSLDYENLVGGGGGGRVLLKFLWYGAVQFTNQQAFLKSISISSGRAEEVYT